MIEQRREFFSDGVRLVGACYLPESDRDDDRPVVIPCSGFTGLRKIHPERFARSLTAAGYRCFAFDYRGFPPSDGEQGRVLLEEQIRDIRSAATFAAAEGARSLVLLGWGMAGGMILPAARGLEDVRGLAAVNGFYDGERVQRAVRGAEEWARFRRWLRDERHAAVRAAAPRWADAFWLYPLDAGSRRYVDEVLRQIPGYVAAQFQLSLADSLLDFAPERRLAHLAEVPLLIAHGDKNTLHPLEEARALHEVYPGPKQLFWLEGAGHTDFMADDNPLYQQLAARIVDWLATL